MPAENSRVMFTYCTVSGLSFRQDIGQFLKSPQLLGDRSILYVWQQVKCKMAELQVVPALLCHQVQDGYYDLP